MGFDTWVAVRHGLTAADGKRNVGCYFCNDVVAPVNVRTRMLLHTRDDSRIPSLPMHLTRTSLVDFTFCFP